MADIFISYSRKDTDEALSLAERLQADGLEVWIDRHGITGAEQWATEIVEGIKDCTTFILLLSQTSVESANVLKELSLASEKGKRILPVDLSPVTLPPSFEYQIAGVQRVRFDDFEAIIRSHKYGVLRHTVKDIRKSLMILPFEDLSPDGDNEWLANGIVSELISALSNVKALRLADNQMTKEFRKYHGLLTTYAQEMNIRYFVQGDVRKFGEQIKISARLLDIETGDYLWQDSMKGTMENIFDFQENVALKVVEGLKVHLASDEKEKLAERGTENAEAYELFLKAKEYFVHHTRADYERALGLYEEAVRLDPGFALPHIDTVDVILTYYRNYSHDPALLVKAGEHIMQAESVLGESKEIFRARSILARTQGNIEEAIHFARRSAELDPESAPAYEVLSFSFQALGRYQEAAEARKKVVELRANDRNSLFNYLGTLQILGDRACISEAAPNALLVYERHLRLNPDDLNSRVQYAAILSMAGKRELAIREAEILETMEGVDGRAFYNIACLYLNEGDTISGMRAFRRAVEQGYHNLENFRLDPDLGPLRRMPEFEELLKELEEKIKEEKHG
jgi:adenylate cyclase